MNIILAGLITLLISFGSITACGQQAYTIKGTAEHMANHKVEMLDFFGDKNRVVDSTTVDSSGIFRFRFTDDLPTGMYRLKFEKGRSVDFIYNGKDIELSINPPNIKAVPYSHSNEIEVLSSGENRRYYDFLRTLKRKEMKTALLNQLKTLYLASDKKRRGQNRAHKPSSVSGSFYNRIEDELNKIDREFEGYIQVFINKNPDSYASKIIKTLKTPVLKIETTEDEREKWMKEHFWDRVDLADATLLHSPVIPSKVLEYISLYKDKRLSREEQEMAIIEAVDVILFGAGEDGPVFDFVLDFVTRIFEKSEYELVLTYITENYILAGSFCEKSDDDVLSDRAIELRDKVTKIKRLAIGKKAPRIRMSLECVVDLKGSAGSLVSADRSELKLSDISAEYTLILFWASWCPHCPALLSAVKGVYNRYRDNGLEVLAISIDKELSAWLNALSKEQYSWINYSELNGWDGKAAIDYNVWSTPRMYLLDKEKMIISKPSTVEELEEFIIALLLEGKYGR